MGKLTTKARNRLKPGSFAVPGKRAYPIPDIDHARDALARSSGKPIAAQVRAAVTRKFPRLKKKP